MPEGSKPLPDDWKLWDDSIFSALQKQGTCWKCGIAIYGREPLTVELCGDCAKGVGYACSVCGRMSNGPRECHSFHPRCAQKKNPCGFPRLRDEGL